jgi:hypothetical protein
MFTKLLPPCHKCGHIQVMCAPDGEKAHRACRIEAVVMAEPGLEAHFCALRSNKLPAQRRESVMQSYVELGKWLSTKGIASYFQGPDQMVISCQNPATPSSNCFWVSLKGGKWYLATWLPAVYCLPNVQDSPEACESVFRSSTTAIYTIAPDIVARYNLRRLSEGEIENLGLA